MCENEVLFTIEIVFLLAVKLATKSHVIPKMFVISFFQQVYQIPSRLL